MITVHHLNNSRSQRVLWMLEELETPYEIKRYQRDPKTMLAPPELRKVHPLGKSPVITDGDLTLAESGAILEYLVDHYGQGRFVPLAEADRIRYRYWMHYAEGSAMPPLLLKLVFDRIEKSPAPFLVRPLLRQIARRAKSSFVEPQIMLHLDYLEGELSLPLGEEPGTGSRGKSEWFAGDAFTAADVQMSFPIEAAAARGGLDGRRPRLMAFLDRIRARPAYRRALERGGKFSLS